MTSGPGTGRAPATRAGAAGECAIKIFGRHSFPFQFQLVIFSIVFAGDQVDRYRCCLAKAVASGGGSPELVNA